MARIRKLFSIKRELLKKSQEAVLAAVEIFNNPNIIFKSEIFVVLIHIAWTYLLHAYYRSKGIEYRYIDKKYNGHRYIKTDNGAYKYWEFKKCLDEDSCPLDKNTVNNLRFLIGLRNEIEHQMTTRIDELISAKFQAACLNFNEYIKKLFGNKYALDSYLSFSLQFSSISEEQIQLLQDKKDLPSNIERFIEGFDGNLTDDEFNSPQFAYRILFVAKTANRKGQADKVIEFVKPDSLLTENINKEYVTIKEIEKPKYRPKQIIKMMQEKGYVRFSIPKHTDLWQLMDGKNPGKGYGVEIVGTWYWYESWIKEVEDHCIKNSELYK